jgi:hypothetical protein
MKEIPTKTKPSQQKMEKYGKEWKTFSRSFFPHFQFSLYVASLNKTKKKRISVETQINPLSCLPSNDNDPFY